MNGQLALFTEPQRLARRRDPVTSHKAAEKAERFIASHEAVVFGAICEAGAYGATAYEISDKTGYIPPKHPRDPHPGLSPVQVNRRLGAMGKRGLIERNGQEREGCAAWAKA